MPDLEERLLTRTARAFVEKSYLSLGWRVAALFLNQHSPFDLCHKRHSRVSLSLLGVLVTLNTRESKIRSRTLI